MLDDPATALHDLIARGADRLPLPGAGRTLQRWRALAEVAARDLSLLKLFEGHTDALATLSELGAESSPGAWALWAAEAPHGNVQYQDGVLRGSKRWCSGAAHVQHALVTVWRGEQGPWLATVSLRERGIRIDDSEWKAVGMARTGTATVRFEDTPARLIGPQRAYLDRPGFWHGAAGIAACWYGAAAALGEPLRARAGADPHRLAHLGAVDAALAGSRAALHEAARFIDAHPNHDSELVARRARAVVEAAVEEIVRRVGRALGAAPFCMDESFARRVADLTVFVRQSHAERDLTAHAERMLELEARWSL